MKPGFRIAPVPLSQVRFDDAFWAPRIEVNRTATIPAVYRQIKQTGRIDAFHLAWKPGMPNPPHQFWDSDVAKWLEAVGYSLASRPDRKLETLADGVIHLICRAQQKDGYLNTHYTVVEPDKRWKDLRSGHELYCAGHLMEAAVAYAQATGKRTLLEALCRYADYIGKVFGRGAGQLRGYPGHEEVELALVKLYRATGERRYLDLAQYFIDERGRDPKYFQRESPGAWKPTVRGGPPGDWCQAHAPVREQVAAEGHSVRAMYLFSAMADLAGETGDKSLLAACRRLWDSVTSRRMYVTGGVGSCRVGERFTFDYDLPNETAYAETCAQIGLVFFAHRMLLLDADSRYADVMERCLYNSVASGVSLDGRRFFYVNPMAVCPEAAERSPIHDHVRIVRPEWYGCACCPPNVARLLASLGSYAYSVGRNEVYVHLYAQGGAEVSVGGNAVAIAQKTAYPWQGKVRITVRPAQPVAFTLALRIPGWCRGARLAVNGRRVALGPITRKGYARIARTWKRGDRVDLDMPMPVERVEARPDVRMDCGRVALQRGPVVFCLEQADNGPGLERIALPRNARISARFDKGLLQGVVVLTATAKRLSARDWAPGQLYRPSRPRHETVRVRAVPYAVWANREPGEMVVWIREC